MNIARVVRKTLLYVFLIAFGATFILPLIWMVRSSFMETGQLFEMPPVWIPDPLTANSYIEAVTITPFLRYALNTIIVLVANTFGILLTGSLSAFGFSRTRWKSREAVFVIILTSMMLPGAVTLIPQFIAWYKMGFYNTLVPLIVPSFFGGGAFNIFLFRQFFMTIPSELDEAAIMDGASYFRIYSSIIIPLSKSVLIVVGIFAFMAYWNDFFNPLIYLNDQEKFTLAIGLQQLQGQYTSRWNVIMAASTIVVAPCIFVFIIGQKFLIEGIVMTGIKG